MARRNISKTAIEGGRARHCRAAEYEGTRAERQAYNIYCKQAANDPDVDEPDNAFDPPYETGRRYREFDDKLSPVKRWLESQVDRPWDKVKSEIVQKFNSHTLAGRHILEHVDMFVDKPEDRFSYIRAIRKHRFPGELYVDDRGFLRQEEKISRKKYYVK